MDEIENGKKFWNEAYKGLELEEIKNEDLNVPDSMNEIFTLFTSQSKRILDFGCGEGAMLFLISHLKQNHELYGIEKGENIIHFAQEEAKLNHFNDISFIDGGLEALNNFEKNSFDGIIISNVLDVVEEKVAKEIMDTLSTYLKDGGLWMIKINPESEHDELIKRGFTNFQDNLYAYQGVLRLRLLDLNEWRNFFSHYGKEINFSLVPWQSEKALDRLFLIKK